LTLEDFLEKAVEAGWGGGGGLFYRLYIDTTQTLYAQKVMYEYM
jgi:hypothetical protein